MSKYLILRYVAPSAEGTIIKEYGELRILRRKNWFTRFDSPTHRDHFCDRYSFLSFVPHKCLAVSSSSCPFPTLRSVQHVFHHVVIKIRQLYLRPAACLTLTLLETGVDANNCICSQDQRFNMPSESRWSFGLIKREWYVKDIPKIFIRI
jgi:hypothetical protein